MCRQSRTAAISRLNKYLSHLSRVHGLVANLEYEVSPDHVEHQQYGQEAVENVVSGEHLHDLQ